MATAKSGGSSSVPSLPPPCPKSPPEYPDLYGKRREMAKVQMLEREIGFLEVGFKFCYLSVFSSPLIGMLNGLCIYCLCWSCFLSLFSSIKIGT